MPTLNWLTREEDIRAAETAPYRLLEEVPDRRSRMGGAGERPRLPALAEPRA